MPKFEIIFIEKVRAEVLINADSYEEAKEAFYDGDYSVYDVNDLDAWDAEIEEIKEVE